MGQAVLVGIDGGASKTAAVCMDAGGRILAACRLRGCAIVGAPSGAAAETLAAVAEALGRQAGMEREDVASWGVGLSGIDFADELDGQRQGVAAALGIAPARLTLVNDAIPALWGATPAAAAAILQHGSGVTAAFRRCVGEEQLFDHLNVGRQYDFRHELLGVVERMLDGRREPTPLCDRVLAHLGIRDPGAYAEAIYRETIPWERRMGTAPLVYDAWLAGDTAAAELVSAAIDDYTRTAAALGRRTGGAAPDIAFGGGVIGLAPQAFWDRLAESAARRLPGARMCRPVLSAAQGAAIMAGFKIGIEPRRLFESLASAVSGRGG